MVTEIAYAYLQLSNSAIKSFIWFGLKLTTKVAGRLEKEKKEMIDDCLK